MACIGWPRGQQDVTKGKRQRGIDRHETLEEAGSGADVGVDLRKDVEELAQAEDDAAADNRSQRAAAELGAALRVSDGPDETLVEAKEEAAEGGRDRAEDEEGRGEQVLQAEHGMRSISCCLGSYGGSQTGSHPERGLAVGTGQCPGLEDELLNAFGNGDVAGEGSTSSGAVSR
jgi:hypothetical protein